MKYNISNEDHEALRLLNEGISKIGDAYMLADSEVIRNMIADIQRINEEVIIPLRERYAKETPAYWELHFYDLGEKNVNTESFTGTLREAEDYCHDYIKGDPTSQTLYIEIYELNPMRIVLRCW